MSRKAVFLDRDGTLMRDLDYLNDPDKMRIYKGGFAALRSLKAGGWKLIVGTNQSGIGRGYFPRATVEAIHKRFLSLCGKNSVKIDAIYYCPHHPAAGCACRKPKPKMLYQARRKFGLDLKHCVVVGDKKCDVDWGRGVGARTVLVLTGKGRDASRGTKKNADHISRSLKDAARWILDQKGTL